MDNKKLMLLLVLSVFIVGMCIGGVSATKNSDGSADFKFTTKNKVTHIPQDGKNATNNIHLTKNEMQKIDDGGKVQKNVTMYKLHMKVRKKVKVTIKKPVYGYKKKKVFKYYQIYRNGKSLGWYFRSPHKFTSADLNFAKKYKGGRITYGAVYGYKKVKYVKYYKKVKTTEYGIVKEKKLTPIKIKGTFYKQNDKYYLKVPEGTYTFYDYIVVFDNNCNYVKQYYY